MSKFLCDAIKEEATRRGRFCHFMEEYEREIAAELAERRAFETACNSLDLGK